MYDPKKFKEVQMKIKIVGLTGIAGLNLAAAFFVLWDASIETKYFVAAVTLIDAALAIITLIKIKS
jgi:hypothetical protein